MNKHRKAEARRVKAYVRILRAHGFGLSYKDARRHIRKRDKAMRDIPKAVKRGVRKGIKRCDRSMKAASSAFARLAEHAAMMGRISVHPLSVSSVAESFGLYQEALFEKKLSEDKPNRTFRRTNYVFLDESTPMEEAPGQWPKENPHIPKEATPNV